MDMDADKLNRELQIFRNHVKIARENIIHKLVRDIKFWKSKHETNADNKRATKKVESLEALIVHIKSQTASELAKAIIRFNPKKSARSIGLEERTLFRFHENKKLQPEVKALIRRFGLNDKMQVLDKYLKNRGEGKKAKTGKKPSKKKEKSNKKSKQTKSEQESEDQGFCEADTVHHESPRSDPVESESGEELGAGKFVKSTPGEVKKKKPLALSKEEKKTKKKNIRLPEEDDVEKTSVQVQDSFFLTSSGQTYVATAPVVDKKQQEQEEKEQFSWKRSVKRKDILGQKEEMPQKRPFRGHNSENSKNDMEPFWKTNQLHNGQRKRADGEGLTVKKTNNILEDADLHPSWAAKQKQRSIQPFVGKKIKFDAAEETQKSAEEDLHPSWAAKQRQTNLKPFAGKKIVFDDPDRTEPTNLHPSWAAKQQQKGLKPFQGKKIVFDTGAEGSIEPNVPTDIHPSWAAKQKEKGIHEFQGKKITFGD